jgi:hypothetical protein
MDFSRITDAIKNETPLGELFITSLCNYNIETDDYNDLVTYLKEMLDNNTKNKNYFNVDVVKLLNLKKSKDALKFIKSNTKITDEYITESDNTVFLDILSASQLFTKNDSYGIYNMFMRIYHLNSITSKRSIKKSSASEPYTFACYRFEHENKIHYKFVSGNKRSHASALKKLVTGYYTAVKLFEINQDNTIDLVAWVKYVFNKVLKYSIYNEFFKEEIEKDNEYQRIKNHNAELISMVKSIRKDANDHFMESTEGLDKEVEKAKIKDLQNECKEEINRAKKMLAEQKLELPGNYMIPTSWKSFKNYYCEYSASAIKLSKNITFIDDEFISKFAHQILENANINKDIDEIPKIDSKSGVKNIYYKDILDIEDFLVLESDSEQIEHAEDTKKSKKVALEEDKPKKKVVKKNQKHEDSSDSEDEYSDGE